MRFRVSSVCFLITLLGVAVSAGESRSAPERRDRLAASIAKLEARGVRVGLEARSMDGALLVEHAAPRMLAPASTVKLLTTACALESLGPTWSTRTRFLAPGPPGPKGILRASLYVEGGGDPLLRGEDLWVALQALILRTGLRAIEGDVVVDARLFDGDGRPSSWPSSEVTDPYDAPQGAFAVGYASTEVIVRPGAAAGDRARVALFPIPGLASVVNRVRTGQRTQIRIVLRPDESGPGTLVVSGTIGVSRRSYREWVRLADAEAGGRAALGALLDHAGVSLGGRVRAGEIPDADLVSLYAHESRPLAELVRVVNKYSSNFGAETLLRHLALASGAPAGTTPAGLASLEACAKRWGLPADAIDLADGSGYSRSNRLSASSLVSTLLHASRQREWFPEWLASLPRAGEDGSLKRRLGAFVGRLRAKTGSLSGVASLAGFSEDDDGEPFAFAVILNGKRGTVSAGDVDELTGLLHERIREERARRRAPPADGGS